LTKLVKDSCNPFSELATSSDQLLNIASGKAVSQETTSYLTNCLENGHDLRQQFENECATDKQRFLKPLKRRKVLNFAHENIKKRIPDKQRAAAESLRDIFIRILIFIN